MVTADTFRNAAVEQLDTHCQRLGIQLFSKEGKKRDPTPVAKESIEYAKENQIDVVLIDTAGRAQNNDALMKQIGRLIYQVKPIFVFLLQGLLLGILVLIKLKVLIQPFGELRMTLVDSTEFC